jgi:hypothetical protein
MSPLTESTRLTCKNYGTPAATAGVAPTLDYRFALDRTELDAVTLTDKLTFTRAATCAFTNLGGNLQLAGANVPRFNHNPTTGESLGLLVEEARTNNFVQSEQFDSGGWGRNGVTVTANTATAPDGQQTGDLITCSNTQNYCYLNQNLTNAQNTTYTVSYFVKYVSCQWIWINGEATGQSFCWFDLVNKTVGTIAGNVVGSVTQYQNGWVRCSATFTKTTASGSNLSQIGFASGGNGYTNGVSGQQFIVWGGQAEPTASFPTSYIPTTTATVTRTESATVSLTGLPATRTLVEKPVGCATVAGDTLTLNAGYTAERVMVFPTALSGAQVTAIRSAM